MHLLEILVAQLFVFLLGKTLSSILLQIGDHLVQLLFLGFAYVRSVLLANELPEIFLFPEKLISGDVGVDNLFPFVFLDLDEGVKLAPIKTLSGSTFLLFLPNLPLCGLLGLLFLFKLFIVLFMLDEVFSPHGLFEIVNFFKLQLPLLVLFFDDVMEVLLFLDFEERLFLPKLFQELHKSSLFLLFLLLLNLSFFPAFKVPLF